MAPSTPTLFPIRSTIHSKPYILDPQPSTLSPHPITLWQDKEFMDVCDVDTGLCTPTPEDLELLQLTTPGVRLTRSLSHAHSLSLTHTHTLYPSPHSLSHTHTHAPSAADRIWKMFDSQGQIMAFSFR